MIAQSVFSEFSPTVKTNTCQVLFDKKSKGDRIPDSTAVMFFPQYKDNIYLFCKICSFSGYLNGAFVHSVSEKKKLTILVCSNNN